MVAIVWIQILVALFVIGTVYIIFSWVLYGSPGLYTMVNASTINDTRAQSTLNILSITWQYWPLPFVVGLILWGIVSSQKREPDSYYM